MQPISMLFCAILFKTENCETVWFQALSVIMIHDVLMQLAYEYFPSWLLLDKLYK